MNDYTKDIPIVCPHCGKEVGLFSEFDLKNMRGTYRTCPKCSEPFMMTWRTPKPTRTDA